MLNFVPTYLYIKKHNVTGLMYFGKTVKDPLKYKGSGKYWQSHIKKYGDNLSNIWYELFTDKESLTEFAQFFSEEFDIVNSDKWANLISENGLDGGFNMEGKNHTKETKSKISLTIREKKLTISDEHRKSISLSNKNRIITEDYKKKLSKAKIGKPLSLETKVKMSASRKNKPQRRVSCPKCNKLGGISSMKRYHFSKCKQ